MVLDASLHRRVSGGAAGGAIVVPGELTHKGGAYVRSENEIAWRSAQAIRVSQSSLN